MLPLGVVIPTKNSRSALPDHVAALRGWMAEAEQVVVVDSESSDGTVEYLREQLSHPRLSFTTHPPGLYASWNHGIAQIKSRYVFLATAGDTITRAGVERLVETAGKLRCDVVISKPRFRNPAGQPVPDHYWPIDDIAATLKLTAPHKLTPWEAIIFSAANTSGALLGSSASNLYRTEVFRRLPFPTNFGTTGDGAWGWMHAAEVSWGIVPEKFSSFLVHPPNASAAERKSYHDSPRADEVFGEAMTRWLAAGCVTKHELEQSDWKGFLAALSACLDDKDAYDRLRGSGLPVALNPAAWLARSRRNASRRRLAAAKHKALVAICQFASQT